LLAVALCGCRPPSVAPPPGGGDIPGPGDEKTVSISYLKTLYKGAPLLVTDEVRIAGAVVSDDGQGNFYNTLVLDDGTAGIEVRLDIEDIHKRFWIHSRVTVRCNGLWLGSYGGTLQLGAGPFGDFQTRPLPPADIAEHIFADNEFYGEVKPRVLRFSELSQRHVSTFVAFEGVSFAPEEKGLSWAETADGEDGSPPPSATDRRLVDAAGGTLAVRTSRHARFAAWPLPEGTGRIEGVLGYFGGNYQLTVWSSECFSAVTP
jgi:hypothetical protein